jgi:hypothetical protein
MLCTHWNVSFDKSTCFFICVLSSLNIKEFSATERLLKHTVLVADTSHIKTGVFFSKIPDLHFICLNIKLRLMR